MLRKTKKAVQASQALKAARHKKASARVFGGFCEESECRMFTTSDNLCRKRTEREENLPIVKNNVKHKHRIMKPPNKINARRTKALLRAKAVGAAQYFSGK